MSLSTILADFRSDNAVTAAQMSDTLGVRWYNDGRDVLIDAITQKKEDYFWDTLTGDLVAGQNEYPIPKRGDLAADGITVLDGVSKTKYVSIKDENGNYVRLDVKNEDVLTSDVSRYADSNVPFYVVSDDSWWIYPTPESDVTDGLKATIISFPKRLTSSDVETLPDDCVKAIMLYVAARYFHSQRMFNEESLMEQKWEREKARVATKLSGRTQSPKPRTLPSLRAFTTR